MSVAEQQISETHNDVSQRNCAIVVDDHGLYRAGLSEVLRDEFGFEEVVGSKTLAEAVSELAGPRRIDLALFDLSMPGMSGPATLAQLRKAHPQLKIAVVSASEDRNHVLAALSAGLHGFIPKSLSNDEIVAAIQVILGGGIFVPRLLADSAVPIAQATVQNRPLIRAPATPPPATASTSGEFTHISCRQRDVLEFLRKGMTNKEIGRRLEITEGTVKVHVACLLTKFRARNRTELAVRQ